MKKLQSLRTLVFIWISLSSIEGQTTEFMKKPDKQIIFIPGVLNDFEGSISSKNESIISLSLITQNMDSSQGFKLNKRIRFDRFLEDSSSTNQKITKFTHLHCKNNTISGLVQLETPKQLVIFIYQDYSLILTTGINLNNCQTKYLDDLIIVLICTEINSTGVNEYVTYQMDFKSQKVKKMKILNFEENLKSELTILRNLQENKDQTLILTSQSKGIVFYFEKNGQVMEEKQFEDKPKGK